MKKKPLYFIKMLPWLAASMCVAWQASASSFLPPQAVASTPQLVAQSATDLTEVLTLEQRQAINDYLRNGLGL